MQTCSGVGRPLWDRRISVAEPNVADQTGPMYADQVRDRLRAALRQALKDRDRDAVSGLRSAIAAIDNAEAVEAGSLETAAGVIAGARTGLGAAEARRRVLSAVEVAALVRAEVDERMAAADGYAAVGQAEPAERLRAEAAALVPHVPDPAVGPC